MALEIKHRRLTKPLLAEPGNTVRELVENMRREQKLIALIVDGKSVIGTITVEKLERLLSKGFDGPVVNVMNRNVVTVSGEEDYLDLLSLLLKNKLDCLVVMKKNKVNGVLTLHDILYAIQKSAVL
ncbi:CBS domain-containing protein [Metallosphaera hakonensis]|uniref:CBS domain-containing protein n=1 Tax=Metallosphaera hakonensis JCM 8857 = DSM 7519 TaxID=1293036 RepID=A0A2U9IR35_9CREN|nr:CBS domain-containing protein [Metallosphaera hakonensis]AWR98492.1 CBS domain-containing protein [Metallosphaera hakonensis JCM 8857 = DSM 7519]